MSPKYYQVKVGNYDIDKEELHYPIGKEDIHFIPVISGAGRGMGKSIIRSSFNWNSFILTGGSFLALGPAVVGFTGAGTIG